jgi:hypothetical protein
MIFKSPKDLVAGITRRIHKKPPLPLIRHGGYLSVISQALYQFFVRRSKAKEIINYLKNQKIPKIFVVDEFFSLRTIDLKTIKNLGKVIYISSDFAYDFYLDNNIASKIMHKLEKTESLYSDLVLACSERDKLKYKEMGLTHSIFYPNIYPLSNFNLAEKDDVPSICLVLKEHWTSRSRESLFSILKGLSFLDEQIKLYLIGIKPDWIPSNIDLCYYKFIPRKLDFLRTLSKSWIGINLGIHFAGTNERKYDYALSGLIVFSDLYGSRGDYLPHEQVYVDSFDLTAKLIQIFRQGKKEITKKGLENRTQALLFAQKQKNKLINSIELLKKNS